MEKFYDEKTNEALKKIADDLGKTYQRIKAASDEKYRAGLAPGAVVRELPGLFDEESKAQFETACENARDKADTLIAEAWARILEKLNTPPSQEATNAIELMALRQNLSADDIDSAMNAFGRDCPIAYETLRDIAEQRGYKDFKKNDLYEQRDEIDYLASQVSKAFNRLNIENNRFTLEGFKSQVDRAFPVESDGE